MKIRIKDKSTNLWLSDGGTFVVSQTDAKVFTYITVATDMARKSGIIDENVDVDWEL